MVQGFDLDLLHKMNRYRDRQETSSRPGPAARSASPTRTTFVRSNTPSPEETMAARLRAENARWPLEYDDDSIAPQAPSTLIRSAEAANTGTSPQPATPALVHGIPSSTASAPNASSPKGHAPRSFVIIFTTKETDMILYLALRGCSKAAIAFALRSEVLRPADIRVADWESVAEGSIKAELEAMVVESPQEPLQDADAIISRVVGYAEAEYWQTSILAQATKYMAAAREVGEQNGRATIVKKMAENAKARILRRKERYRDVAETFNTMAAGIDIRLAQRYQEKIEARYPRTPMDWMPCSEENMATNLFLLQYTGLLINQLLEKW